MTFATSSHTQRSAHSRIWACAIVLTICAGCATSAAKQRWQQAAIASYRTQMRISGDRVAEGEFVVEVAAGVVQSVRRNGDDAFEEEISRQSFRVDLTQVVTRSLVMNLNYEGVTDA